MPDEPTPDPEPTDPEPSRPPITANDVRIGKTRGDEWSARLGFGPDELEARGPTPRDALLNLTFRLIHDHPGRPFDASIDPH